MMSLAHSQESQQLLSAEAVTQHKIEGVSDSELQLKQLTFNNAVERQTLHPLSYTSNSSHLCARNGDDAGSGVRAINLNINRSKDGNGINGNSGSTRASSGIGATVVMVLLAAINVTVNLPAAVLEIICMLFQDETLELSTRNMRESLCRLLFENLCFAHALNFFVYTGR